MQINYTAQKCQIAGRNAHCPRAHRADRRDGHHLRHSSAIYASAVHCGHWQINADKMCAARHRPNAFGQKSARKWWLNFRCIDCLDFEKSKRYKIYDTWKCAWFPCRRTPSGPTQKWPTKNESSESRWKVARSKRWTTETHDVWTGVR